VQSHNVPDIRRSAIQTATDLFVFIFAVLILTLFPFAIGHASNADIQNIYGTIPGETQLQTKLTQRSAFENAAAAIPVFAQTDQFKTDGFKLATNYCGSLQSRQTAQFKSSGSADHVSHAAAKLHMTMICSLLFANDPELVNNNHHFRSVILRP
jgi:hypothetical protein